MNLPTTTLKTNARPSLAFLVETTDFTYIVINSTADLQAAQPLLVEAFNRIDQAGSTVHRVLSLYGTEQVVHETLGPVTAAMCEILWSRLGEHQSSRPVEYALAMTTVEELGIQLAPRVQA